MTSMNSTTKIVYIETCSGFEAHPSLHCFCYLHHILKIVSIHSRFLRVVVAAFVPSAVAAFAYASILSTSNQIQCNEIGFSIEIYGKIAKIFGLLHLQYCFSFPFVTNSS